MDSPTLEQLKKNLVFIRGRIKYHEDKYRELEMRRDYMLYRIEQELIKLKPKKK